MNLFTIYLNKMIKKSQKLELGIINYLNLKKAQPKQLFSKALLNQQ